LSPDARPAADLVRLAQLLSGQKLDERGRAILLEGHELQSLWDSVRSEYPANFRVRKEPATEWHRYLAELSERESDWFAAIFHLERLIEESPSSKAMQARLRTARERQATGRDVR
jgi:hypothetical protein